jgi:hypothetical protein
MRGNAAPTVVSECLVGFGHAMGVFALAHGGTAVFGGIHELMGEAERHRLLAAGSRGFDDPAHGERLAALRAHFHGHLVGGAADAARLHFNHRLHVVERGREHGDGIASRLAGLLDDAIDRTVEDSFGGRLLAALHDDVHELGEHVIVEFRVRQDVADGRCCAT